MVAPKTVLSRAVKPIAECMEKCGGDDDEPGCEERCRKHAAEVAKKCEADGGSPEDCAVKGREAYAACMEHCGDDEPDCEERCRMAAAEKLKSCQEAGGEDCEARAREYFENCVEENCEDADPEPRPGTSPTRASSHPAHELKAIRVFEPTFTGRLHAGPFFV